MNVDWKKVAIFGGLILVIAAVTLAVMGCNKDSGAPPPIIAKPGQIVVMPPGSNTIPGGVPPPLDNSAIQRDMERLGRIEANQSR